MSRFDPSTLRRLVVKVGSALLVDDEQQFAAHSLHGLAEDIAGLSRRGCEVLVVSSGAVAIGCRELGIDRRRARLDELQAAAAAGQVQLVNAWQDALDRYRLRTAQILLTPDDTEHRPRYLNARGTLLKLLEHGVVPVINENDTVATDELRYGDNDRLAARVAQMVMADGLVLLSDVDGLYSADPRQDPSAGRIDEIAVIDESVLAMASGSGSAMGSGGMRTKVEAARIATHAGCSTVVASGRTPRPLQALIDGAACTVFVAGDSPAAIRKQWLAGRLETRGSLSVDDGAVSALGNGSSLLPVGVQSVSGDFRRGDAVALVDGRGVERGRGLVCYDADEIRKIAGCRSQDIAARLGYGGRPVVVHRDDLVVFPDRMTT
ncbi:MAG: glutamate 5-kinase [Woeseiaceae bacterium]|nr:glutamate 5-kinase [Woeseiaceae bacterium]